MLNQPSRHASSRTSTPWLRPPPIHCWNPATWTPASMSCSSSFPFSTAWAPSFWTPAAWEAWRHSQCRLTSTAWTAIYGMSLRPLRTLTGLPALLRPLPYLAPSSESAFSIAMPPCTPATLCSDCRRIREYFTAARTYLSALQSDLEAQQKRLARAPVAARRPFLLSGIGYPPPPSAPPPPLPSAPSYAASSAPGPPLPFMPPQPRPAKCLFWDGRVCLRQQQGVACPFSHPPGAFTPRTYDPGRDSYNPASSAYRRPSTRTPLSAPASQTPAQPQPGPSAASVHQRR